MKRWRILTVGTTEVFLHPSVFVYLLYAGITGHLQFTMTAFVSIILHEGAHSLVASCLGQRPSSIEITPLGAVMRMEDDAMLPPLKHMLVILAGPAATLFLCWLAIKCVSWGALSTHVGQMIFLSNLSILLLNLLPVLPLDGGRLLKLLLDCIFLRNTAATIIKIISMIVGTGLIILNILFSWRNGGWNLSLAFAGCCILYSASMYSVGRAMSEMRFFLDRKIMLERKGGIQTRCMTVLHTVPISRLARLLPPGKMMIFICIEAGTGRMLGCIHESALIQNYLTSPSITLLQAVEKQNMCFKLAKYDTI